MKSASARPGRQLRIELRAESLLTTMEYLRYGIICADDCGKVGEALAKLISATDGLLTTPGSELGDLGLDGGELGSVLRVLLYIGVLWGETDPMPDELDSACGNKRSRIK